MKTQVVSKTGTGASPYIKFDVYGDPQVSIQCVVNGTVTYTVQQTLDDPDSASPTWFSHSDTNLVNATVNVQGNYAYTPIAMRVNVTAGSGTVTLTVLQAGRIA